MRYASVKNRISLYVVLTMAVLASACGGKTPPNTSPEGQAAITGRQVIAAADAVLTGVDQAMTSKQLPTNIGLPIVKAIREIGVQGKSLATYLAAVDAAKNLTEKQDAMSKAQNVITAMDGLLTGATSPITDPALKSQVGELLRQLVTAINQVRQIVNAVRPSTEADPVFLSA